MHAIGPRGGWFLNMDMTSGGGLVALVVGLTTALATVVVALINGRQSRRDARENLKRDIELAKGFPDDSPEKERINRLISKEISDLGYSQSVKAERMLILAFGAVAIAGAITMVGVELATFAADKDALFVVRACAYGAIAVFLMIVLMLGPSMKRHAEAYGIDMPPASRFSRRARGTPLSQRLKAAWTAFLGQEAESES